MAARHPQGDSDPRRGPLLPHASWSVLPLAGSCVNVGLTHSALWSPPLGESRAGVGPGPQAGRTTPALPGLGAAALSWQGSQGGCPTLHLPVGIRASPLAEISRASVTCKQTASFPSRMGRAVVPAGWRLMGAVVTLDLGVG